MKNKHETRDEYIKRLDKTAASLDSAFINNSIGNLQERCQRLFDAEGGLFEEGGSKRRAR